MKYLKRFEALNDDNDTMAKFQIFGVDAKMYFNFNNKSIYDREDIERLIDKYLETYSRSDGDAINSNFIKYFNDNYNGGATLADWFPTINLEINTHDMGVIIIGFDISNKRYTLFNWSKMNKDIDRDVFSEFKNIIRNEVDGKMDIDETIENFNLHVENRVKW